MVFEAANGGTLQFVFPGGGEFEIKVFNAATGQRVEEIVETSQAASSSVSFAPQSFPIYVKVEGPGAWTVAITIG